MLEGNYSLRGSYLCCLSLFTLEITLLQNDILLLFFLMQPVTNMTNISCKSPAGTNTAHLFHILTSLMRSHLMCDTQHNKQYICITAVVLLGDRQHFSATHIWFFLHDQIYHNSPWCDAHLGYTQLRKLPYRYTQAYTIICKFQGLYHASHRTASYARLMCIACTV